MRGYERFKALVYGLLGQMFLIRGSEKGQTLVEYALLLILIAVVVITAVAFVGLRANNVYCNIGTQLPQPS